tara:strand:- start:610 stop:1653 length:1044 start_codon:yes stop_codon:yes gene_type:complete
MDYNNEEVLDERNSDFDGPNAEAQSVDSVDAAATKGVKSQAPARKGDKKNSEPKVKLKSKAGMVSDMYNHLNDMSKEEIADAYDAFFGEGEEVSEERYVPVMATEADFSEDLNALVESEATLSDEFKQKTAVIFESALKTKLSEEVERIESAYEERLAEEVVAQRDELVEKVDSYLNYVVENWMEENRVAIQSGLRTEIAENFMESLKGLFVESYVDVPESKVDLVDDLAEQVEELEESLYQTTANAIELGEEIEVLKRHVIISEAVHDLADTQVEKFETLVEDIDFEDEDSFAQKVLTIKESYFTRTASGSSSTESLEESYDDEVLNEEATPSMERYLSAIRKSNI